MIRTQVLLAATITLVFLPLIVVATEKAETGKAVVKEGQPFTFPCERSHAGNFPGISCEMILSKSGLSWKFLETFNREVFVPWDSIDSWKSYGEAYGYTLAVNVTHPPEGGGSFRFSSADRNAVIRLLRRYSPTKER